MYVHMPLDFTRENNVHQLKKFGLLLLLDLNRTYVYFHIFVLHTSDTDLTTRSASHELL